MSPACSLSVKGPAGAHVDLWAVWQSGLCLHFQKIQEVLLYSVCQTVRSCKEVFAKGCSSCAFWRFGWFFFFWSILLPFDTKKSVNSSKSSKAKLTVIILQIKSWHVTFICSYNVGCTKRVGLFPNRKTLENERKRRIMNGNIKNYLLEYKKVRLVDGLICSWIRCSWMVVFVVCLCFFLFLIYWL